MSKKVNKSAKVGQFYDKLTDIIEYIPKVNQLSVNQKEKIC